MVKRLGYHCIKPKTICNKQLHSYLSTYNVRPIARALPSWFWQLSQKQCRILVNCLRSNRAYLSIALVYDIMRLCLHAGWSTRIYPGEVTVVCKGAYNVDVNKTQNEPIVDHRHQSILEESTEPVFCLQIPSDAYYVCRNGLPVWIENLSPITH